MATNKICPHKPYIFVNRNIEMVQDLSVYFSTVLKVGLAGWKFMQTHDSDGTAVLAGNLL